MKKQFFTFVLMSLVLVAFGQKKGKPDLTAPEMPVDQTTKLITYTGVVQQQGTSEELYNKALNWAKSYFKNAERVIKTKDATNHKLVFHPLFKVLNPPDRKGIQTMGGIVSYFMTVECRDGRYKFTINKFAWKQPSYYPCEKWMDTTAGTYQKRFGFFLQQLDKEANKVSTDLKKAMGNATAKKNDNW